jgi:hypothetical protein
LGKLAIQFLYIKNCGNWLTCLSLGYCPWSLCHPQVQVAGANHAELRHFLYAWQGRYWRDW